MEEPDTNNENDQPEESITYYNIRTDLKATNKIIITTSKSGESNYWGTHSWKRKSYCQSDIIDVFKT